MKAKISILALAAVFSAGPAWPDAGEASPAAAKATANDPDFRSGVDAWKRKDWPTVTARMGAVVQREPNNADAWNYLGHAARQQGDLPAAFKHYERALQIDPKHRGAHEYVGEAYLMAGNLAKAEEHLRALDKLCVLPCEEYTDLKAEIERYRRAHPS
jgi:cytochrome c-type biogenesis protein CcmH/NrfG